MAFNPPDNHSPLKTNYQNVQCTLKYLFVSISVTCFVLDIFQ